MNAEQLLKLQAYVDGELSRWRVGRVQRRIANDPEAQQVVAELQTTKRFLAGNEVERSLPEDPQFYWSRIRQALAAADLKQEAAEMPALSWRRILAPLAGVAMAVFLAIAGFKWAPSSAIDESFRHIAEIENLSEDTDSVSFRSASENMFVVWIHDKTGAIESDADFMDDEDFSAQ